jgi:hypothetical protein
MIPRSVHEPSLVIITVDDLNKIHTSLLHSMDPQVSQMTIGCGISHNNTIRKIQVQFIPL